MVKTEISIHMQVCRNGQQTPDYIVFDPNDYFDLEGDSSPDIDSVPRYLNMIDYLEEKDNVDYISITITNKTDKKQLHIETHYFDSQKSTLSRSNQREL